MLASFRKNVGNMGTQVSPFRFQVAAIPGKGHGRKSKGMQGPGEVHGRLSQRHDCLFLGTSKAEECQYITTIPHQPSPPSRRFFVAGFVGKEAFRRRSVIILTAHEVLVPSGNRPAGSILGRSPFTLTVHLAQRAEDLLEVLALVWFLRKFVPSITKPICPTKKYLWSAWLKGLLPW